MPAPTTTTVSLLVFVIVIGCAFVMFGLKAMIDKVMWILWLIASWRTASPYNLRQAGCNSMQSNSWETNCAKDPLRFHRDRVVR